MELLEAAENGDVLRAEQLVSAGASVDLTDNEGWTPLMKAAREGHLDMVRFLVEHGAAVNVSDKNGCTPLIRAAVGGHLEVVQFLVEHKATVDASYCVGWTPLMLAANGGHLDMVQFLVGCGADVDVVDEKGRMPLTEAAYGGHLNVVQFLVEHGATVEARYRDGWTPLLWAVGGGCLDVVQFLVECGVDIKVCNIEGWTLLMEASVKGHLGVVRFLVERGAVVNESDKDQRTALMEAASSGCLDVVRFLVESGATVDASDNEGWTPLYRAAYGGHLGVVKLLEQHGAEVNVTDENGTTALMRAAYFGHLDVVQFLVEHGATVDARASSNWTPLMWAAIEGCLGVVRYLVEFGADVDARDIDGRTPLSKSAKEGYLDVVHLLVKHGAIVNVKDNGGRTPLMWAAFGGFLDIVHFLVECSAQVDARDNDGRTPLMEAAVSGNLKVVQFLVERGACVDAREKNDQTPLMWAAQCGHYDIVRFLVEHGAAIDARSNHSSTSLMGAALNGHIDIVRFLVERGAVVNARSSSGRTTLSMAAESGHLDVVQFLVGCGANTNQMSVAGDTALSIANKYGRQEVVQFLLPLVRYQHQRKSTENSDEQVTRHSNIPSSWLISPFEIEVEPFIDSGHIGGDYRGKWLDADVVVKSFIDDTASTSFDDEVRLWHQLRHPNILKLYGVCDTEHKLFVCEYASKGSLPEYLKSCDAEHRTPWKFLHETALGLEYLHERKIVHGNLRGSNILIGNDGLAKLSEFGLSALSSSEDSRDISGELVRWVAPESLRDEAVVSFASDVYSLGMCIIEAVSGEVPYNGSDDQAVRFAKVFPGMNMAGPIYRQICSTLEQEKLLLAMCRDKPRERPQIPAVVDKLERLAEIEAEQLIQSTSQPEPEPVVNLDAFDSDLWIQVQTLVDKSENNLYRRMWHELELIYDTLKSESHPWSTLQRFHDLLSECRVALDAMSQQSRVCRLSATRARDHSVQGLHRRISQLLQHVCPQDHDAETRETEWKRLCRDQVEVFVSEASEACVMLSSVDTEEDRSALVAVLRAELRTSDGKYTDEQVAVLQKTHDEIVSKSLEDVKLATTPEWFIPWFELEMNENDKPLGEGGFGSVIKARWLDSEVVVKKLEIADKDAASADKKREMRQMFEREVDIWFGLSHPHVVRLFGACHVGRPFFVCELAPNGTLDEYLRKHPDELWLTLREAALGVQYLHARGIVHGDLKGNNILIGSDGKAKVTDFGLSGMFDDDSADVVVSGAWHWVAPECILGQQPTSASDVYSLGMCIIEALRATNGDEDDMPWRALPNAAVKFNVTRRHLLPPRPQNCSDEAWTLIERMCKSAPTERMLIMTVVDELEKLACRHGNVSGETDQIAKDIDKMRQLSSCVADTRAEMENWRAKCDAEHDWESGVLEKVYQLLWDRLEQVVTQVFPDGDDTVVNKMSISDLSDLVERSKLRTREVLDITGGIPLIKFTELALGGYTLHRRLDKFMAAHSVPKGSISLHDWTSACSAFMRVSTTN